jgi:DNA-binding transcriptional MerR regulator
MKSALAKLTKEAQERREKLTQWESLGVDADNVKTMLQQQREAELKKAEEEGRYIDLLEKIKADARSEREELQRKLEATQQKMMTQIYERELNDAISREDGIVDLLEGKLRTHTKIVEDDNGYNVVVLEEDGSISEKSVRDLLREWKKDDVLSHGFKAPRASGAGTNSNTSTPAAGKLPVGAPKMRRSQMTISQRVEYRTKYGKDAYNSLPL